MSERDETTGQFTSAEPLFGKEALERDAGYVPFQDGSEPESQEALTVEDAAAEYTASKREPAIKTSIDDLPENVTLTIDQAAKSLSDESAADQAQAELEQAERLRAEVDKLRGVDPDAKAQPVNEGELEPDLEKALNNPKIKDAIAAQISEAENVRQAYSQATDVANNLARASFIENFPEIAGLPLQQWEGALAVMAQREPDRFGKAVNSLNRVVQLQNAQQQQQQQNAEVHRVRLQAETTRFEDSIKDVPKARRGEVEGEIVNALKERGANMEEVVKFLRTSEASSASVMGLLWELGETRLQLNAIKSAPKAIAAKSLPPVQRPGVSQAGSQPSNGTKIQALERQLAVATGDRAARISADIYALERKRG